MKVIVFQASETQIRELLEKKSLFRRKKEVVKLEKQFLPCYVFELFFRGKNEEKRVFVLCDGLHGKVRRIIWPQSLVESDENLPKFMLDEQAAHKRVNEEAQWTLFPLRLRMKRKYRLVSARKITQVGFPFWIVYFKKREHYSFSVFDGISGKAEDAFGREIFLEVFGLREKPESSLMN